MMPEQNSVMFRYFLHSLYDHLDDVLKVAILGEDTTDEIRKKKYCLTSSLEEHALD